MRKASSRRVSTHSGANASGWEVNARRATRDLQRHSCSRLSGHVGLGNRSLSKLWINALSFSHVLDWEE